MVQPSKHQNTHTCVVFPSNSKGMWVSQELGHQHDQVLYVGFSSQGLTYPHALEIIFLQHTTKKTVRGAH